MPPTRISIRLVVETAYKGGTKQWGWRFFLNNTTAMTGAVFNALAAWLAAEMANTLATNSTIIAAIGYDAGSDVPTNSATLSVAGVNSPGSGENIAPLEVSALLRFTTDQRTSKNHPIYLFKYLRNQIVGTGADREAVVPGRRSVNTAIAGDLVAGHTTGGTLYKLCGPYGAVAQSGACEEFLTHRDFPK